MSAAPTPAHITPASGATAIQRWMYAAAWVDFCHADVDSVLGALLRESAGSVESSQRQAWVELLQILRNTSLPEDAMAGAHLYLEWSIPRLGRRVDALLLLGHVVFVIEFKVGESAFQRSARDQVWDYALDLKNFHDASRDLPIVPLLIATAAPAQAMSLATTSHGDLVARPVQLARGQLADAVRAGLAHFSGRAIDVDVWERGRYQPTPTIVEAARALYAGHAVAEISRSDATATNLASTAAVLDRVTERSRRLRRKGKAAPGLISRSRSS